MTLNVRNNSSAWTEAQDLLVRNNSAAWVQGCAHIWDGTQWVQFFGQNGTVDLGADATLSTRAESFPDSSAGAELIAIFTTNAEFRIDQNRGGTLDPGSGSGSFFSETIERLSRIYSPTPCSPDPPLLSIRYVSTGGQAPNLGSLANNVWYDLTAERGVGLRTTVNANGGEITRTSQFRIEIARTEDLSTILDTCNLSFTATAFSGVPE